MLIFFPRGEGGSAEYAPLHEVYNQPTWFQPHPHSCLGGAWWLHLLRLSKALPSLLLPLPGHSALGEKLYLICLLSIFQNFVDITLLLTPLLPSLAEGLGFFLSSLSCPVSMFGVELG